MNGYQNDTNTLEENEILVTFLPTAPQSGCIRLL